jgi:hypothetical protein
MCIGQHCIFLKAFLGTKDLPDQPATPKANKTPQQ